MTSVIFKQKTVRESFLQEILISQERTRYRLALEQYINQNDFKIYR